MKGFLIGCAGACSVAAVVGLTSMFATSSALIGLVAGGCVVVVVLLSQRALQQRVRRALRGETTSSTTGIEAEVATPIREFEQRLQGAVRDGLVARKLAEEQAQEAQRVLAALDDLVIVFDEFDEVVEANPAAIRLLGCATDGKPQLRTFLGDDVLAGAVAEAARGATIGETRRFEHETAGASETDSIAWQVSIRRLDESDRCVVVLHDVTRDREVARMKSDFVTKASHELRTPLSSIHAYIEMLADGEVEGAQQQAEFLRIVHEESARLSRLVDNMLDISRIEAGVAKPKRGVVDLARVSEKVVEAMKAQASERSIDLVIRANGDDLTVDGDEDMLAEVVENLVSNAVKYTPEGGRVAVSIDPDGLTASIVTTVTDTGLGIPPDDIDHLFEKFYRISRYEREARGTGLGLNLCRNIVEEVHHGRIGVDSTLGMGSRFWFSVPVRYSGAAAA